MKARVYVSLKPTVLDPQGKTIQSALQSLGYSEVTGVRQGKFFEIDIAEGTSREQAEARLRQVAGDVLANPVIEEFQVEVPK